LRLVPLVLLTAGFELIGVSAVIPFLTLLADPGAVFGLPIVGPLDRGQPDRRYHHAAALRGPGPRARGVVMNGHRGADALPAVPLLDAT
jgi:hypothetical protein